MHILIPKRTTLKDRLKCDDVDFVGFVKSLCNPDQNLRPTASEALNHKFLKKEY